MMKVPKEILARQTFKLRRREDHVIFEEQNANKHSLFKGGKNSLWEYVTVTRRKISFKGKECTLLSLSKVTDRVKLDQEESNR